MSHASSAQALQSFNELKTAIASLRTLSFQPNKLETVIAQVRTPSFQSRGTLLHQQATSEPPRTSPVQEDNSCFSRANLRGGDRPKVPGLPSLQHWRTSVKHPDQVQASLLQANVIFCSRTADNCINQPLEYFTSSVRLSAVQVSFQETWQAQGRQQEALARRMRERPTWPPF